MIHIESMDTENVDALLMSRRKRNKMQSREVKRQKREIVRRPNSTSTLRINSTIMHLDNEAIIEAVAFQLHKYIINGDKGLYLSQEVVPPKFQSQTRKTIPSLSQGAPLSNRSRREDCVLQEIPSPCKPSYIQPSRSELAEYLSHIFLTAQCSEECNIVCLIYIDRLLQTSGELNGLNSLNWKGIVMTAMILASKVWDDLSMVNEDFSIFMPYNLKQINKWEAHFLKCIGYNVRVRASEYAGYYFNLRKEYPHLKEISIQQAKALEISSTTKERDLKDLSDFGKYSCDGKSRLKRTISSFVSCKQQNDSFSPSRYVIN